MKSHLRVTLLYLGLGVIWILFSDRIAAAVASDNMQFLTVIQTLKGWTFVGGSALVLYFVTRKASHHDHDTEGEKKAIYHETVQGVYHIVFNYMNNMQMVLSEAERCDDFNRETLDLARASAMNATQGLRNLQELSEITPRHIHDVLYARMEACKPEKTAISMEQARLHLVPAQS
jgi:hypothetical protein